MSYKIDSIRSNGLFLLDKPLGSLFAFKTAFSPNKVQSDSKCDNQIEP